MAQFKGNCFFKSRMSTIPSSARGGDLRGEAIGRKARQRALSARMTAAGEVDGQMSPSAQYDGALPRRREREWLLAAESEADPAHDQHVGARIDRAVVG